MPRRRLAWFAVIQSTMPSAERFAALQTILVEYRYLQAIAQNI